MSAALGTTVKGFREPRTGGGWLRIDPLLLLATLGLIGCSLYTVATATIDDIPGSPRYYLIRQAIYCAVGLILMFVISRFDYSRQRE